MTTTEIALEVGQRGDAVIDSTNRNKVRKWLRGQGVSSYVARTASIRDMRRAYNDTSNACLRDLMEREADESNDEAPSAAETNGKSREDKLREALAGLVESELDESRVIELIREHAPESKPMRFEVQQGDVTRAVEGAQHEALPRVLAFCGAGVHVWMAGPSGSGKTHMAKQVADGLGRDFYSTGAVNSDFRLVGFVDAKGEYQRTPFREAFEHGGVFLWDEIDASNPNALVAFNQALSNGHYTFPDGMVEAHPNFVAIAAANTWGHGATAEYVGRTRIDAATVNRFAQVNIDYDETLETELAGQFDSWARTVQTARHAAREHGIKAVITPRDTVQGAIMLAAGMDTQDVIDAFIRRGMDDTSWSKIHAAIQ
ncbi:AAA family ATPase [Salinisphaera sp.]|uniref:AAA family ATPase n=1 Tax=Salinisphaera sp. TaxID=1914330 RepID=UPI000C4E1CDD|nr:AAA family ATPase [Salinisphaera sp.]MAS09903.1 hypothetical protein [Salinisphaera sp.]MAS09958.1 hypothetical protein [Salinisphaera sp.]|tara:strand:- start:19915 stop:21030 length:1116 start_codon:yes stop_codon:yes gene_type:complete